MQIKGLSNVKEEVYGALDSFIAWELEFPLITVKKALKTLEDQKEWKRIIQVLWILGAFFPFRVSLDMISEFLIDQIVYGDLGDKVDVKQRSRENNGELFHTAECFGRGWEA